MRQPTPLWQVVSICVVVLIASFTGIISQSNTISSLREKITGLEEKQYEMQNSSDKKFDKLDNKIDAIQKDTRDILINLERKQNIK